MKRLIPILLCLVLLLSCENNAQTKGELTVKIASAKINSLTVEPGFDHDRNEHDHITKIEVTITSTFTIENAGKHTETKPVSNGTVSFSNLTIGTYTLHGKAYNKYGEFIASGETSVYINATNNTAVLDINKLEGSGEFSFIINYQYYGVPEDQLDIRFALLDSSGSPVDYSGFNKVTEPGAEIGIEGTLPSGNYIVTVDVYVDQVLVDGYIQTFRVCPGFRAGGRFNVRGTPPKNKNAGVTVTNSTSNKMECIIKKGDLVDNKYTLTTTMRGVPEGYTEKDLTYQWYKNGQIIPNATTPTLEVIKDTSYVQYSVVVKSDKIGSWASHYMYI